MSPEEFEDVLFKEVLHFPFYVLCCVGWNEKLFSVGGKEVLIKAVIQSIPTYTMCCFQLPKGLCDDIHKICAKFWWGEIGDKKKIHWASWKKL
ncbi:MAG: hypothetical protein Q8835_03080, partial [Sweet potato little leaf phytoplasma]|nr:hypothetical protein [Sweet potato little leaf phytoplasma]